MAPPIFSSRARISAAKGEALLRCYAARTAPKEAARQCQLSINTVYLQYARMRDRLIATRYYRDGALSFEEAGLSEAVKTALRERRGIPEDEIYPHAAELIEWAEEWPEKLVRKHIRKLIELTGPIDAPYELSRQRFEQVQAYVRYARTELIHDRAAASEDAGEFQRDYIDRAKAALDAEWRAYRTATKRVERSRDRSPKRR